MLPYRVVAFNVAGETPSNTAILVSVPAAPSNLVATAASATQVNLTWTDNASNETGFQIQRSPDGVTFTTIATVGANVVSFSDTTVAASTAYWYQIVAVNLDQRGRFQRRAAQEYGSVHCVCGGLSKHRQCRNVDGHHGGPQRKLLLSGARVQRGRLFGLGDGYCHHALESAATDAVECERHCAQLHLSESRLERYPQ